MVNEEYEMIPHKLLSDLKFDVEALQKKLSQPDSKTEELLLELESVKSSLHELTSVFQQALKEMKDEGDIGKKLDAVISQNETIARGMIAISDKVENWMSGQRGALPKVAAPVQHRMGPPQQERKMAPFPAPRGQPAPPPTGGMDFPPPPPSAKKKRGGIFS